MRLKQIDQAMTRLMRVANIPGAAVAILQGEETYTQGYGVKERGTSALITTETLFANASTTKAFTCTGIALLVEEGKMAWDDPVRKYLPDFRLADSHADSLVTVRDLVCHRTGLPRHDMLWYHSSYTRAEVLRRIGFAKLTATFRGAYQYQNICYAAAGEVARVVSGYATWEMFLQERLLKPLGMHRTTLSERDAQADPNHAEPHQRLRGKICRTDWLNFDCIAPAGTMNSCAEEMVHWLRFQLSGGLRSDGTRLLSEKALRETHTPQMVMPLDEETRTRFPYIIQQSYCLGWSLWNYRGGVPVLGHGGAIDGFRAHVVLLPTAQVGIALFANLSSPFVESARNYLMDILLDLEPWDWANYLKADIQKVQQTEKDEAKKRREQRKKRIPPPLPLTAYIGEYEDPAFGVATVALVDKTLTIRWNAMESALRPLIYQTFLTTTTQEAFKNREVRFRANAVGEIVALQLFDSDFIKREQPTI
jgi:CubicO group peptidase (beta-lactamase class C family)